MLHTLLIIVLILALLGALPVYPYSRTWGPAPSSLVGVILVIALLAFLF